MRKNLSIILALFFGQQIFAQTPSISSFTPASGPVGTSVTIAGSNFSSIPANNIVFFGAVKAAVNTASTNSLTVTVPAGATFQPITLTVNALTAYSIKPFMVTFPDGGVIAASSFAPKVDFPSGKGPSCIASGDMDGDGKPDIISVNDTSNTVAVLRNVSTGSGISFSPKADFSTGAKPYCIVISDLDGDGKPDMAVANGASNTVSLFRNISTGAGDISFAAKVDLQTGTTPYCISIRDFNSDGKPDLAVVNSGSSSVSIFKNNSTTGNFSFSLKTDITTASSPFWIDAGDLDNDGKPDIAIANGTLTGSVSVLRNTSSSGNISFASRVDFDGGSYGYGISVNDIDGDNKLDLTVADGSGPATSVLLNSSSGSGNISFLSKYSLYTGSNSFSAAVNDLDGDGKPDIAAASSTSSLVSVLRSNSTAGNLSFEASKDYTVGSNPWVVAVVDLNGDGKPEIATANNRSGNISILKNTVSDLIIHSFSPSGGIAGTTVTITGLNFIGTTGVSFGGVPAASFTVNSSTSISAVVDTGASGNVTVTRSDATNFLPGFTFIPTPLITSFSPTSAGSGDTITIAGNNFSGISSVNFGGTPAASYFVPVNTIIKAIVGEGGSGKITVTSIAGTALLNGFVYDNTPSITSISPAVAPTGATVLINGRHFTGTTAVNFGVMNATSFTVNSPTEISAIVGLGASGSVTVTNPAASANFSGFTYIPPPSITSFSPTAAGPLDTVTITGNSFSGATVVTFGNVLSNSFTVNSNNSISAVVPGGSSGKIKVTANGSVDSIAGFKYVSPPVPVINSFTPLTGAPGTIVTISGSNFSSTVDDNIVYFGAVRASVVSANATTITVKAPVSTSYLPITVTNNNHLTAYSSKPFVITFPENEDIFTFSSFANKIDYTKDGPGLVLIHDLNGDSKPDLISIGTGTPATSISIFKNISSDTNFILDTKTDYYIYYNVGGFDLADLDGDGQPDLIVTVSWGSSAYFYVYRNISTSTQILFDSPIPVAIGGNYVGGVKTGDIDGDGKPDLAIVSNSDEFSIYRNVSTTGKIVFAGKINFPFYRGIDIAIGDLDNDKKAEVIITDNETDSISVYKNISTPEVVSFSDKISFSVGHNPFNLSVADFNGDGKNDIAVVNYGDSSISLLKNLSTSGNIAFAEKINYRTMQSPGNISISDFDGDSKPDLLLGSNMPSRYPGFISLFKNNSTATQISFKPNVDYYTGGFASTPVPGDLNGDGRSDIAVANGTANTVSILINKIGKFNTINLCAPLGNGTLSINIAGLNYQWQLNTGAGFNNISDSAYYTNSNTPSLQLNNIPSWWSGYQYRCIVDGNYSEVYKLKFIDSWIGSIDTSWENPGNWTCNNIPDSNTDVIIDSGTLVINSNVTIRSLTINPGGHVTVNPGFKLVVLH
jgi:hypothetical protein